MAVLALLVFLGLYTWNIRSGYLDKAVEQTGMEVVGIFLSPIEWVKNEVKSTWHRYIYLVNAQEENEFLNREVARLSFEVIRLKEEAAETANLQKTLMLTSPTPWPMSAARVLAWRMGPFSALETMLIDRGSSSGVKRDDPAITHQGIVGRVIRVAPSVSTVLMLTDLNSRIAVRSEKNRSIGILVGSGPGQPLRVLYVPVTSTMEEGEVLMTSGLDGLYPPGLPAARIISIQRPDRSQFQAVTAVPFVDFQKLEGVVLLEAPEPSIDRLAAEEIVPPPAPTPEENATKIDDNASSGEQTVGNNNSRPAHGAAATGNRSRPAAHRGNTTR